MQSEHLIYTRRQLSHSYVHTCSNVRSRTEMSAHFFPLLTLRVLVFACVFFSLTFRSLRFVHHNLLRFASPFHTSFWFLLRVVFFLLRRARPVRLFAVVGVQAFHSGLMKEHTENSMTAFNHIDAKQFIKRFQFSLQTFVRMKVDLLAHVLRRSKKILIENFCCYLNGEFLPRKNMLRTAKIFKRRLVCVCARLQCRICIFGIEVVRWRSNVSQYSHTRLRTYNTC